MENTNYLFFLEPYTFIFHQQDKWVLYNTLSGNYLICPDHPEVLTLLEELNEPRNGYCVHVPARLLNDPVFVDFIHRVREAFSGDLVKEKAGQRKPYIFKPMLFFNYTPEKLSEKNIALFGERILLNLNEVTLFLPHSCKQHCGGCGDYYKQTLHCACLQGESNLSIDEYVKILSQLDTNGVERVNLMGGEWYDGSPLQPLLPVLAGLQMKKSFYLPYTAFTPSSPGLLLNDSAELVILVHPGFDEKRLLEDILLYGEKPITWKFIVTSTEDVVVIDELNLPDHIGIEITPYYTGTNHDFFKENIFLGMDDILDSPVSKQTIFRRQILNEHFFGKLFITPTGDVYANMNQLPLGNVQTQSLKELVYNELYNSSAWLRTRSKEPCSNCVNKLLCPSISNYELVMEQENLCLVTD